MEQPLIVVTGRADLYNEVYFKAGFAAVVKKPISSNFLLQTIEVVFANENLPEYRNSLCEGAFKPLYSLRSFDFF